MPLNVTGGHATGMHGDYLVIKAGKAGFTFRQDNRLVLHQIIEQFVCCGQRFLLFVGFLPILATYTIYFTPLMALLLNLILSVYEFR